MLVIAVVNPELLLAEITVQVLHGDLVERADDGALEQAPDVLDAVRVDVADDPLLRGVADALVSRVSAKSQNAARAPSSSR